MPQCIQYIDTLNTLNVFYGHTIIHFLVLTIKKA